MSDPHYPSVDISFILERAKACGKLADDGIVKIGATTTLVLDGPQPIFKRTITMRELKKGELVFEQATNIAIRLNFLSELIKWLEENKHWKDGAYKTA